MDPTVKISIAVVGVLLLGVILYFATSSSSSSSNKSSGQSLNVGGRGSGKPKTGQGKKDVDASNSDTLPNAEAVEFTTAPVKLPDPMSLQKGIQFQPYEGTEVASATLFTYEQGTIQWADTGFGVLLNSMNEKPGVFAVGEAAGGKIYLAKFPDRGDVNGKLVTVDSSDDNEEVGEIPPELLYGRLYDDKGKIASPVSIDNMTITYDDKTYLVTSQYLQGSKIEKDFNLTAAPKTPKQPSAVNAYAWITKITNNSNDDEEPTPPSGESSEEEVNVESDTNKSFTGRTGTLVVSQNEKVCTVTYTPHVSDELSVKPPKIAKVENYKPINAKTLQSIHGFWCDAQGCWLVYTKHVTGTGTPEFFVHIFHIVEDASQKAPIYASSQKVHKDFTPEEFRYSTGLQQPYLKTDNTKVILLYVNKNACVQTSSTWTAIKTAVWNGVKSLVRSMPGALHAYGPYIAGMALGAAETLFPEIGAQVGNSVNMIIGFMNPGLGAKIAAGKHGYTYGLDVWNTIGKMAANKLRSVAPGTKVEEFKDIPATPEQTMKTAYLNLVDTFSHYKYISEKGNKEEQAVVAKYEAEFQKVTKTYNSAASDADYEAATREINALSAKRDTFDTELNALKKKKASDKFSIKTTLTPKTIVGRKALLLSRMQSLDTRFRMLSKTSDVNKAYAKHSKAAHDAWMAYSVAIPAEKSTKSKALDDILQQGEREHNRLFQEEQRTSKNMAGAKTTAGPKNPVGPQKRPQSSESYTSSPSITYLEEQMAAVNTTLSSHERMLDSIQSRVDTQSTQLQSAQQDVVALQSKVDEIERKRQAYQKSTQAPPLNSFLYF